MHVGPIDPQLAVLQRVLDMPSARAPSMALASATADTVLPQAQSAMMTPPATSVQMLVAIAAATPPDDRRRLTVEAERGRGAAERFRRQQGLDQPGVAQVGAVLALEHEGDEPDAPRLLHEAELRLFEELAKTARGT